jgi:hypothetical protein
MKAKLVDSMPTGGWIYEIKFDGYRALALRGGSETRILSRNQKDLGSKLPEVRDSIVALDLQDAIISVMGSKAFIRATAPATKMPEMAVIFPFSAGFALRRTHHCRE